MNTNSEHGLEKVYSITSLWFLMTWQPYRVGDYYNVVLSHSFRYLDLFPPLIQPLMWHQAGGKSAALGE